MRYLLTFLFAFAAIESNACTVCGCSASNQYLGILPQFHRNFVGIQLQQRQFNSEHPVHEGSGASTFSRETFNTVQLWGRYNLGRRLQVFGFLPYICNVKTENGNTTALSGIGDATVLANIKILAADMPGRKWKHNLQAGGGIKLPTGDYNAASMQTAEGLPNMQPGTNSWDMVLNANYTVRRNATGINTDVSYTFTSPNANHYKYGNRLSAGASGFYWHRKKDWTLLPQAGIRLDFAGPDFENYRYNLKNDMSGGMQLYASLGTQVFYKRIGIQLMYHHPLAQHYAKGLVRTTYKTEAGAFFLF